MCHQSVGLIARHLESLGYPTTSLSSSWFITASANPPRAAFLDYPLGHTAGRPNDLQEQIQVTTAALGLIETATRPGQITPLPQVWPTEWKTKARELSDKRTERHDTPQYERPTDEIATTQSL
ncbi:MAG: hypothetical protein ACI88C_001250 [Acidimicrobiales bacterium]